jgi:hypothetical protein
MIMIIIKKIKKLFEAIFYFTFIFVIKKIFYFTLINKLKHQERNNTYDLKYIKNQNNGILKKKIIIKHNLKSYSITKQPKILKYIKL